MADHPNLDLLKRGYAAYGSGDLDTINELFADDVVWHISGRSSIAGDYTGESRGLRLLRQTAGAERRNVDVLEVHDLLANDEHGVAIVTESATPTAKPGLRDPCASSSRRQGDRVLGCPRGPVLG